MNRQKALLELATSTAEAAADVLRGVAPESVAVGSVSVEMPGRDPVASARLPAVTARASYVEGVTGATVFLMPLIAARKLAAAIMGADAPPDDAEELTQLELSAVGDAMGRMMTAAAASTRTVLQLAVEIGAPDVRVARTPSEAKVSFQGATRSTIAELFLFGEPCRLVQLVPTVFTTQMTQAFGRAAGAGPTADDATAQELVRDAMYEVPVRVSAELGRARLRCAQVAALDDGAIIDLDRSADAPVDLYVNGSRIATGQLICVDGTDWAVVLDEVFHRPELALERSPDEG